MLTDTTFVVFSYLRLNPRKPHLPCKQKVFASRAHALEDLPPHERKGDTKRAYLILSLYLLLLAVAVAGARAAPSSRVAAFWDAVARCETGGNWHMRGPTYSGGVGFYNPTWTWWAGELHLSREYPNAADAPRLVQIRVAQYGLVVHHGYWGCLH